MQKRALGRTGFFVTEIGLGTWALGGTSYGHVDERDAKATIRAYLEGGGNFIDTARGYHLSERIIGTVLKEMRARDKVILCSKMAPAEPIPIRSAVEESLRELQTETIDLLYLHNPPEDIDQMIRTLDVYQSLKREGKIRAIGASIKGPSVTQATVDLCRQYIASAQLDALQVIFSILRQKNREIFADAARAGVAIVARTLLESGMLGGHYRRNHQFPQGDHRARWNGAQLAQIIDLTEQVGNLAVRMPYQSVAQVALRFVLDEPGVTVAIPGAKHPDQVQAHLAAAELQPLPGAVREELVSRFRDHEFIVNPT
jgi:aryl-alcohol dehydrogenase-like predicted oxidoreductase